ncbi:MAG: nitroreductase family protein [Defluviitaleaceae bacterium]|nr:nitroreductase family protein [Defluviitaleaceae bacterium]
MNNQVLDVIRARRAIRAYKDDVLTKEQMDTLINAALHAPSAFNKRAWNIIAVTDKALLKQLDKDFVDFLLALNVPDLTERIKARGNSMLYNAPALFIVTAKKAHDFVELDGGVMAQTFALAAKSIGLDSVIIGALKDFLSNEKGAHYKEKLQFLPEYEFMVSVAVGHASQDPIARNLTFDDKVTYVG